MMRKVVFSVLLLMPMVSGCRSEAKEEKLPPPTGSTLPAPDVPELSGVGDDAKDESGDDEGFVGTGTLRPKQEAQLGPKGTGIITAITVDEGDKVKKGQVLFKLDASHASLGVQQAEAAAAAAKVGLASAKLDYDRTKELLDRGSIAPATFDQVKARYEAAQANVNQAKVALSMARKVSFDTVVTSPMTGVVTAKLKSVGETATMMPPTVVLVVQDVSKLELRARLPERSLSELKPGVKVRASFPALKIERVVEIERINPTVDPRTRTVEIVTLIDNEGGELKPGMLAEVRLVSADAGTPSTTEKADGGK